VGILVERADVHLLAGDRVLLLVWRDTNLSLPRVGYSNQASPTAFERDPGVRHPRFPGESGVTSDYPAVRVYGSFRRGTMG
jgi:hypothetical protein